MDADFEKERQRIADVYARYEPARHAAEVEHVARLGSFARIRSYLLGVEEARGFEAARELREEVWTLIQSNERRSSHDTD